MNANDYAAETALFNADTYTLADDDGTPAVPPGNWRDVEGPEEAPDAE